MIGYEDMDVVELQHAYAEALEWACESARKLVEAYEAGDMARMTAMHGRFKVDEARVRRIKYAKHIGVS